MRVVGREEKTEKESRERSRTHVRRAEKRSRRTRAALGCSARGRESPRRSRIVVTSRHRTIRLAAAAGETKSREIPLVIPVTTRKFYHDIYCAPRDVPLNRDDFTSREHKNLTIPNMSDICQKSYICTYSIYYDFIVIK